jgi:hypothetical protein
MRKAVKGNLIYERVFVRFFKRVKIAREVISRMIEKEEKKKEQKRGKTMKTCPEFYPYSL